MNDYISFYTLELIHGLVDLGNLDVDCFCKCEFGLRVIQTVDITSGNPDSIGVVES